MAMIAAIAVALTRKLAPLSVVATKVVGSRDDSAAIATPRSGKRKNAPDPGTSQGRASKRKRMNGKTRKRKRKR